jgi:Concanavalin A-like lectin/glucanases superfamily
MKAIILLIAFLFIACFAETSQGQTYLLTNPNVHNFGTQNANSSGWVMSFTVTVGDYSGTVQNDVTLVVTQNGPGTVTPAFGMPPLGGTFTLGPTSGLYSQTLQYLLQFPSTVGYFQGDIVITDQANYLTNTTYTYFGTVPPAVGVNDYVQLVSSTSAGNGPTTFSPSTGSRIPPSCNLSFCPINYFAKFFDVDNSGTTVTSWTWKIDLYHLKGSYALSLPAASSTSNTSYLQIMSAFTLPPNYDWFRDANGDILTKVQVNGMDSDGYSHHAEQLVGIKYPPSKTSGTLQCMNETPLANKPVTVEWWDSTGMLASQATTTDSAGHFNVSIACADANHTNERFVISTPTCTKWTVPTNHCWGNLGTLYCIQCGSCVPPPAGLVDWWTFDETAGNVANDIAQSANQLTLFNGPTPSKGKVARALCFDGQKDFASAVDHPEINFLGDCSNDVAEQFTIDTWVKTTGSGLQVILDKRKIQGLSFLRGYSLFIQNGSLGFQMATGPGAITCSGPNAACSNYVSPSNVHLNDGQWHFIAVTVSRCRLAVGKMYVDGNVVQTFTPRAGDISNHVPLLVGKRYPLPTVTYFAGCLDELEIFKRILSKTELDSIYHAGRAGKCKPSGPIITDRKAIPVR